VPNELYALDLSTDPAELSALSTEALRARLVASPKPVHRIKSNGAPILTGLAGAPPTARGRSLSDAELERRAASVSSGSPLAARIIAVLESTVEPKAPSAHVEEQLYDSFASNDDMALAGSFHQASWETRAPIADRFVDRRLRTLARRLIYDENPELLSESERNIERGMIAERLLSDSPDSPWCTLSQAIASCRELLGTQSGANTDSLSAYLAYCEERQVALRGLP
jgi:exodeoxyribonuclease-1